MKPYWSAKIPDGTKLDLAVSMLQKCVRRGREADAIYLIKQLYHGRKQKLFACDIWRKLYIYAGEEVGLADILLPMRLQDLERAADRIAVSAQQDGVTKDAGLLYLVMAVMILCRVKKSRAVDNAIHWFDKNAYTPPTMEDLDAAMSTEQAKPTDPELLDDSKDKHTSEGRAMGRGDEHFEKFGARLENKSDVVEMEPPTRSCPTCKGRGEIAA
jgi:replication-associated recombination protein RarA